MSDYQAKCATNYFRVTSLQALTEALASEGFQTTTDPQAFYEGGQMILIEVTDAERCEVRLVAGGEFGMWPDLYDEENEEFEGGCEGVIVALTGCLADDSVAVLTEVGSRKWEELCGNSIAVSASGETVAIDLADITELARQKFADATVHP